ncbi:endo-1,4-beta-xylanase [Actinosynnema sp. NPDC050801]|uniref:endo-1,4-beta-xylanase n=1 Tax=unclassified Actinosynnema TaxID=2637065 RepID=UPI0033DCF17A
MRKSLEALLAMVPVVAALVVAPNAAATAQAAASTPASTTAATLKDAASISGRLFGAAAAANLLRDAEYVATLNREFNQLTPENEMKWDFIEPNRGLFNYAAADRLVSHAESQGMTVRGHALVWHSQLPAWVQNMNSPGQLLTAVHNHISNVASHFSGRVAYWNVANEAFDDTSRAARRNSVFQRLLGDAWIEEAFRATRAADPTAKLCYSDYFIEGQNPKSDAVYALVKDFKSRGVPIDCVGFQAHLTSGAVPADMRANLQRFADLGVDVHLTELDIAGSGTAQADSYAQVVRSCLAVSRCTVITLSGVTDKFSWRVSQTPLLFDRYYTKKPAYDSVLSVLIGG